MERAGIVTKYYKSFEAVMTFYEEPLFTLYFMRKTRACVIMREPLATINSEKKFYAFNLYKVGQLIEPIKDALAFTDEEMEQVEKDLEEIKRKELDIKLEGGYSLLL